MKKLTELVKLGSEPIAERAADVDRLADACGAATATSLRAVLESKNGFYAFEGALHVLSDCGGVGEKGLMEWNREDLWRKDYDGMADGAWYFAEDVFGVQFCLREGAVHTFDPETGSFERMASNLEGWATQVLKDYNLWTGYQVAHDWQARHGKLPAGCRLVPITPFVLGGQFEVSNVHLVEAVKGMRYRASIAVQIRDLPDGAKVRLQPID